MTLPQAVIDKEAALQAVIQDIEDAQEAFKALNGKYQQTFSTNGDADIFCHEYKAPEGLGYIIYAKVGNWIKAVDKGLSGRSSDWREVVVE